MYHSISDDAEPARSPYYKTVTSPGRFAAQMSCLAQWGYRGLDLESALESFAQRPNEKVVGITFDDGFRDFHTDAYPALREHGFSASVFLPTSFIQQSPKNFKERPCLTWSEVRELRSEGIRFGSHTVNHPQLRDLPWGDVEKEIRDSKKTLENELQESIRTFAYPFAFPEADSVFVEGLQNILRDAGFRWSVTTRIGRVAPQDAPFTLPRLPMNGWDDRDLLWAKLNGSYDWLARVQRGAKHLRSVLKPRARGASAPAPQTMASA